MSLCYFVSLYTNLVILMSWKPHTRFINQKGKRMHRWCTYDGWIWCSGCWFRVCTQGWYSLFTDGVVLFTPSKRRNDRWMHRAVVHKAKNKPRNAAHAMLTIEFWSCSQGHALGVIKSHLLVQPDTYIGGRIFVGILLYASRVPKYTESAFCLWHGATEPIMPIKQAAWYKVLNDIKGVPRYTPSMMKLNVNNKPIHHKFLNNQQSSRKEIFLLDDSKRDQWPIMSEHDGSTCGGVIRTQHTYPLRKLH